MKNKIISITLYICAFSLIIIYFYVDIFLSKCVKINFILPPIVDKNFDDFTF